MYLCHNEKKTKLKEQIKINRTAIFKSNAFYQLINAITLNSKSNELRNNNYTTQNSTTIASSFEITFKRTSEGW